MIFRSLEYSINVFVFNEDEHSSSGKENRKRYLVITKPIPLAADVRIVNLFSLKHAYNWNCINT